MDACTFYKLRSVQLFGLRGGQKELRNSPGASVMGGLRIEWEMTVAEKREGENRERKPKMDHRRGGRRGGAGSGSSRRLDVATGQEFWCLMADSTQLLSAQAVRVQTGSLWLSVGCAQVFWCLSI